MVLAGSQYDHAFAHDIPLIGGVESTFGLAFVGLIWARGLDASPAELAPVSGDAFNQHTHTPLRRAITREKQP